VPGVELNVPAATATPLDQITRVEMVAVSGVRWRGGAQRRRLRL